MALNSTGKKFDSKAYCAKEGVAMTFGNALKGGAPAPASKKRPRDEKAQTLPSWALR
jgi:hypothetical protein